MCYLPYKHAYEASTLLTLDPHRQQDTRLASVLTTILITTERNVINSVLQLLFSTRVNIHVKPKCCPLWAKLIITGILTNNRGN